MITISTGSHCLDSKISEGISPESIVLIYGEPETGKTTLAIQCAVSCASQGLKVLFVDCDNTFSSQRLYQITQEKFEQIAEQIILIKPRDFKEQATVLDNIQDYTVRNFGLIIVDTFTSLYSAMVAESSGKGFSVNRELNRQLAVLAQTAKIRKIPVLIISQVRAVLDDLDSGVAPVATRVLSFWADTIISMRPTNHPQTIKAIIEKRRENSTRTHCYLQIGEAGIKDTEIQV
jgi:RecA/RadA recombinase